MRNVIKEIFWQSILHSSIAGDPKIAHAVMDLRMHQFTRCDINVLTLRADHDAGATTNEWRAATGIELERPQA
jgi:hypothetical protein